MPPHIRGGPEAAPFRPSRYPVVWPLTGQPLNCTLLADCWVVINAHWADDTNGKKPHYVFCPRPRPCPLCRAGVIPRWPGYMPAWSHDARKTVIAYMPYRSLLALSKCYPADRSMKGLRLKLLRGGKCDLGPVLARQERDEAAYQWEGEEPDIWPTLCAIYGPACMPDDSGELLAGGN